MNKIFEALNVQPDSYASGQVIINAGKEIPDIHYIVEGYVQVYDLANDGSIKTILILQPGEMYPLIWGFDHPGETVYYYKAIGNVVSYKADRTQLREMLDKDPVMSHKALLQFVYLTWDLMERVKCLQMPYTYEKLLRMLPYLVAKIGVPVSHKSGVYTLEHRVTQQEMAQLIGVTRESMSQYIRRIEKEGIINRKGNAMLIDLNRLPTEYIFERWFNKSARYESN